MSFSNQNRPLDLITVGRLGVSLCAEQIGGSLPDAQSFRKYLGGSAGSIAVGAARLGLRTAILSCIGQDAMGSFVRQRLQEDGVDMSHLYSLPEFQTPVSFLGMNPPDDFPQMYYRERAADMQLTAEHLDKDWIKRAKALVLTGTCLSTDAMRTTSMQLIKHAKASKTSLVLDLDVRPDLWRIAQDHHSEAAQQARADLTRAFQTVMPDCVLVVGTADEVRLAGGHDDFTQALKNIRSLTDALIVISTPEWGCEIYQDDIAHPLSIPGYPVSILNILSANDAFISGLLSGWLSGLSWPQSAVRACASSAITITRHGMSTALPCLDEVSYFIDRYTTDPNLCYQDRINFLHNRCLRKKQPERIILAFDHRWPFEQSCDDVGRAHSFISAFKQHVLQGFLKVRAAHPDRNLAILVDMEHGYDVLREANAHGVSIGVPVEAAGSFPVRWIEERPIYEQILHRPANWVVKISWKYHPNLEPQMRLRQLTQLQLLARVCESLERTLEVDLIIPSDMKKDAKYVAQSMDEVYNQKIYPDIWKVEPFHSISEWQQLHQVIEKHDPAAKLVMLAGNVHVYQDWSEYFKLFKNTQYAGGFTIGRSVFWEPWQHVLSGHISLDDVPDLVADNFERYIQFWFASDKVGGRRAVEA